MMHALARVLHNFDCDGSPAAAARPLLEAPSEGKNEARHAEALRELELRVRAEEKILARQALDAALAADRATIDERWRSRCQAFAEQQAAAIEASLVASVQALENRLAEGVARILTPVLGEAIRQRVLDELVEALRNLLGEDGAFKIMVSGPGEILGLVAERLGAEGRAVVFRPSDAADIRVVAEDTVIETQLAAWDARLHGIMRED